MDTRRIVARDYPIVKTLSREQDATADRLLSSLSIAQTKMRTLQAFIEENGATRYAARHEQDLDLMIGAISHVLDALRAYRSARSHRFLAERVISDMLGGDISVTIAAGAVIPTEVQTDAIPRGMPPVQPSIPDVPADAPASMPGPDDPRPDAARSGPDAPLSSVDAGRPERASARVALTDRFPVRFPGKPGLPGQTLTIPRSLAEQAYKVYVTQFRSHDTLDRFAERGGFWAAELDCLLSCKGLHLTSRHTPEERGRIRRYWLSEALDENGQSVMANGRQG